MKASTLLKDPLGTDLDALSDAKIETLAKDLVRTILREVADAESEETGTGETLLPEERLRKFMLGFVAIFHRDAELSVLACHALSLENQKASAAVVKQVVRAQERAETRDALEPWLRYIRNQTGLDQDNPEQRDAYFATLDERARGFVSPSS